MTRTTYADCFRPAAVPSTWLYDLFLILGGSFFIGLSAQVVIPLPFSPVPLTGQTFAVLLIAALFGRKRGVLCLLTYLTQGLTGLPVFVGRASGFSHLLGATGGYLVGFVAAAFVVGWLAERGWDRRLTTSLLAMAIGNAVIYLFGIAWLAAFVGVGQVLPLGLYPFVIGDAVKIVLAAALLPLGWKALQRLGDRSPSA